MFKKLDIKRCKRLAIAGGVGLTAFALPMSSAFAQIEEIIVVARKVEENLQDVPISVTAITGANLKDAGITEFTQIAALTPNFDIREDDVRGEVAAVINIRGQNSTASELSIDQAVGISINGVPVTRGTNLFGNLFDVEQVEILRGPQGTLFGKNSTGGVVLVHTTAPKLGEFSGYGEVTVGNFSQADIEAVVNIPLAETAALRIGAASTNRDGFAEGIDINGNSTGREFGDDNEDFFRASLLVEPNEDLSIRVNADYHDVDENGGISRVLRDGFLFGTFQIAAVTPGDLFDAADNRAGEPELTATETNFNVTVEADLGFADLTSITGYRDQETFTFITYALAADIPIGQESELFTQELRLSGATDNLQWQTGLFFSNEEGEDFNNVGGRGDLTVAENDSFAVFAQGTYSLSDSLSLTAGARWTDEERFVERIETGGVPVPSNMPLVNEAEFDDVTWTVALDYKLTDETLIYGSVSEGFRSGGIDGDNDIDVVVEPEFVLTSELGFKGDLFNDSLRFNAAIWQSDYEDIQISSFTLDPNAVEVQGVPVSILRNAAEATLKGFEAELQWYPTSDFSLSLGVGYTDGEYDEFLEPRLADPADPTSAFDFDRSDESIGGPELQFNATARYGFDIGQNSRATAQLTYTYLDEQILASPTLSARFDPGQAVVDSIGLFNGQIDFDIGDDLLNVAIWGTNLANDEYSSTGFAFETLGLLLAQRSTGAPRQFGVRIRRDF